MSAAIFVSYRRQDEPFFVRQLRQLLVKEFPDRRVFVDVDDIAAGQNFRSAIIEAMAESHVVLTIIGGRWLEASDDAGRRRLDDPQDWVAVEIEEAMKLRKRVIPVLVGDSVGMPTARQLPSRLSTLTEQNAVRVSHERFDTDIIGLIKQVRTALDEADALERAKRAARGAPSKTAILRREKAATRGTLFVALFSLLIAGGGAVVSIGLLSLGLYFTSYYWWPASVPFEIDTELRHPRGMTLPPPPGGGIISNLNVTNDMPGNGPYKGSASVSYVLSPDVDSNAVLERYEQILEEKGTKVTRRDRFLNTDGGQFSVSEDGGILRLMELGDRAFTLEAPGGFPHPPPKGGKLISVLSMVEMGMVNHSLTYRLPEGTRVDTLLDEYEPHLEKLGIDAIRSSVGLTAVSAAGWSTGVSFSRGRATLMVSLTGKAVPD